MKTVQVKGFLHAKMADKYNAQGVDQNGCVFSVWLYDDLSSQGYTSLGPYTWTIELPDDFDPRPAAIKALQKEKAELMTKYQTAITDYDRRINELLAIENGVTT